MYLKSPLVSKIDGVPILGGVPKFSSWGFRGYSWGRPTQGSSISKYQSYSCMKILKNPSFTIGLTWTPKPFRKWQSIAKLVIQHPKPMLLSYARGFASFLYPPTWNISREIWLSDHFCIFSCHLLLPWTIPTISWDRTKYCSWRKENLQVSVCPITTTAVAL